MFDIASAAPRTRQTATAADSHVSLDSVLGTGLDHTI